MMVVGDKRKEKREGRMEKRRKEKSKNKESDEGKKEERRRKIMKYHGEK